MVISFKIVFLGNVKKICFELHLQGRVALDTSGVEAGMRAASELFFMMILIKTRPPPHTSSTVLLDERP